MIGQFEFSPVRQLIKLYCSKVRVAECPIEDADVRMIFLNLCSAIDASNWADVTKQENKKIALVFCSKFSRDTAYLPVLKDFLRRMRT